MSPFLLCIAGAESTGKSWLAHRLAAHFGIGHVPEFAREYCAVHGNHLSLAALEHVGLEQDGRIKDAMALASRAGQRLVIADTDALVTAVWAQVGHGTIPPVLMAEQCHADLTLVTDNDLPWRDDGVRIQRDDGARDIFRAALITALDQQGRAWRSVGGTGEDRLLNALTILEKCIDKYNQNGY